MTTEPNTDALLSRLFGGTARFGVLANGTPTVTTDREMGVQIDGEWRMWPMHEVFAMLATTEGDHHV